MKGDCVDEWSLQKDEDGEGQYHCSFIGGHFGRCHSNFSDSNDLQLIVSLNVFPFIWDVSDRTICAKTKTCG